MNKANKKNKWALIISVIGSLAIDLSTKHLAETNLSNSHMFTEWLGFNLQYNKGVALGIQFNQTLQILASLVVLGLLIYYGWKEFMTQNKLSYSILFGIIIGGAIGNLVNRLYLGHVIDFIVLGPIPTFNFADIGIVLGLVALFGLSLKK